MSGRGHVVARLRALRRQAVARQGQSPTVRYGNFPFAALKGCAELCIFLFKGAPAHGKPSPWVLGSTGQGRASGVGGFLNRPSNPLIKAFTAGCSSNGSGLVRVWTDTQYELSGEGLAGLNATLGAFV